MTNEIVCSYCSTRFNASTYELSEKLAKEHLQTAHNLMSGEEAYKKLKQAGISGRDLDIAKEVLCG